MPSAQCFGKFQIHLEDDKTICEGVLLFHHRIHCHRLDFVPGKTEQLAQPQLFQLVLLGSTDVEERRHNVSHCSKEGVADGERQDRVEDRNGWSHHPDELEQKDFREHKFVFHA